MITWAREHNGLSIPELATCMDREPAEIEMWENGNKSPSYTILEELAYRHLHMPLAVFFFPVPPNIEDPIKKFRRLPTYELSRLSSDTLRMIRLAQGYQESLRELTRPEMITKRIFLDLNGKLMNSSQLAYEVRKYLGISIEQQFEFKGQETAFKAWRHSVENVGIFTFKDSF